MENVAAGLRRQLLENHPLQHRRLVLHQPRAQRLKIRTLQRSFATTAEPLSAYIRRRRLEEATRLLLATPSTTISEAAARWHFTDSSHFVRTFRKQYDCTPSDYIHRRRSPGE
ncbi:helix-turn-helix transcriptional regulator [Actinoplanes sp. NPDC051470]|uniref:helix-turn-helix transcriptional regulator n=1 Tax=Actinoplanes sp. NPDC051470 TaxID=3157224 RepID=UPI00342690B4